MQHCTPHTHLLNNACTNYWPSPPFLLPSCALPQAERLSKVERWSLLDPADLAAALRQYHPGAGIASCSQGPRCAVPAVCALPSPSPVVAQRVRSAQVPRPLPVCHLICLAPALPRPALQPRRPLLASASCRRRGGCSTSTRHWRRCMLTRTFRQTLHRLVDACPCFRSALRSIRWCRWPQDLQTLPQCNTTRLAVAAGAGAGGD